MALASGNLVPRVLSLPPSSTLVAAGHVSMYTNQIRTGGGSLTQLCQHCLWRWKLLCLTDVILKVKQVVCQSSCLTGASFLSELLWVWDVDWEGSLLIFTKLGIVTTTAAPAVNRIRCYNQCFRLIFWLFCKSFFGRTFRKKTLNDPQWRRVYSKL